jgi:hypothetical protein
MESTINVDTPIACSLSPTALKERQNGMLQQMRQAVLETRETLTGYAFRFALSKETIGQLAEVIALESECCPFITFRLTAASECVNGNGTLAGKNLR